MYLTKPSARALILLALLIAIDLTFIALHMATLEERVIASTSGTRLPDDALAMRLSLARDGSYGEIFQYVKTGAVALCFLVAFLRRQAPLALVAAGFFGYILLDDALTIHEQMGPVIKALVPPALAILKRQAIGEAMFVVAMGGIFALAAYGAYRRSDAASRRVGHTFFVAVAALVLCGFGADLLHAVFKTSMVLFIIEDGGEMIAMSVIAAMALMLMDAVQRAPLPAAVAAQNA